ncbi:hypothetical protein HY419_01960, partial [candidate division WWE3 bacterium]|nr:hypothetical protein [candidate division WWE3 bacterium]
LKENLKNFNEIKQSESETNYLYEKMETFKLVKVLKPKVQNKIELVYKATPKEITISRLGLRSNVLSINLTAPEGKDFARFVTAYLQEAEVSEIHLVGALYDTYENNYDFNVEVILK